jgi:hypothetical protein
MRKTENARDHFKGALTALRGTHKGGGQTRQPNLGNVSDEIWAGLEGLRYVSVGLEILADAIGDVYDKLEQIDRKLGVR